MQTINIGKVIAKYRKDKGITQEELSVFLGVSKPAVSKWESGQSYPDITLLPIIADYFNLSVDKLLGYENQMSENEVKKLYLQLSDEFTKKPFEDVYNECIKQVKSHYTCWNLIFSMAELLINHSMLAGNAERIDEVIKEAADLCLRVEKESDDVVLARQALSMRAYCYLALKQPEETIRLLDGIAEPQTTTEVLLAKAYAVLGNTEKAISLLQIYIYKNIISIFGSFPDLISLYAGSPEKADICLEKALSVGEVFGLKKMHPSLYFTVYFTSAITAAAQNRKERALELLESYVELILKKDTFPLKLKGSEFFDLIEPFFETFNLGNSVPRSDKLILKDLKGLLSHPSFSILEDEGRYQLLLKKLEHVGE